MLEEGGEWETDQRKEVCYLDFLFVGRKGRAETLGGSEAVQPVSLE